jgi:hypothetical protein
MQKPIRLKEVNRMADRIKIVREQLINNNNNSYQRMGASSFNASVLDPKTAKIKDLFQMFGLNR